MEETTTQSSSRKVCHIPLTDAVHWIVLFTFIFLLYIVTVVLVQELEIMSRNGIFDGHQW